MATSRLPAEWTEVLETVARTLADWEAAAAQRQRAVEEAAAEAGPDAAAWATELRRLAEQLRHWADGAPAAEAAVAAAAEAAAAVEQRLRQWLAAAQSLR
ncbi:MAG: hypothetical protein NZ700_04265 [Gemmataceae bacterium]|nr:hypothetical protein [Gemmataceae bacterium]MDW8266617.1 hypothetical protein [Gemmataceae bacterium]